MDALEQLKPILEQWIEEATKDLRSGILVNSNLEPATSCKDVCGVWDGEKLITNGFARVYALDT